MTGGAEPLADRRARAALPNHGGVDWTTGVALPDDRRLALIRDPDCCELAGFDSGAREGFAADRHRGGEDLHGIVLDVAGGGIELADLTVGASSDLARLVEDDRARTRGPLVERENRAHSVLKRRIGSTSRR